MMPDFKPGMSGRATLLVATLCWLLAWGLQAWEWDEPVFRWINSGGQWLPVLWASLSVVGLGLSALILMSATHVALRFQGAPWMQQCSNYLMGALLWALLLGGVATYGLKSWFATARPAAVLNDIEIIGQALMNRSMPSGHAITAFTMAGLLLWAWRGQVGPRLLIWLVAALIAVSRITTAAHWPSDVLAGMGVGLCVAWLALYANHRFQTYAGLSRRFVRWLWAVVLVGCGVAMLLDSTGYPMAWLVQWGLGLLGIVAGAAWLYRLVQRCD